MNLNEYLQAYFTFEIALNQTRLIALAAGDVLKDFPTKLPPEHQKTISDGLGIIAEALVGKIFGAEPAQEVNFTSEPGNSLIPPAFKVATAQVYLGKVPSQLGIDSLPFSQELVMVLAHLDAFMADSLRAMCRKEPRMLRKSKKMSWEQILESGSWENLIDRIIEEYIYEFSWKSIYERCQFLQAEHGLQLNTPSDQLAAIDDAEKLRHLVIHNGSRVSQEYLDRTMRKDVKIGDILPVAAEYTSRVGTYVELLASDICIAIATKYYMATEKDLFGVARRG